MPETRRDFLPPAEATQAVAAAQACLGASLVAAYLHGSAVAGGLRPDSDVDILLVVDRPMADAARQRLLAELLKLSGRPGTGDPRRPLELAVFCTTDLEPMSFPPRSEFVYGEWLRAGFEAGSMPHAETNPDFTILIAQARRTGVPLTGPPAWHLLPEVPADDLRRAIGGARKDLLANLQGDERNVLLTLARMWCTLETGEIVPKDVAAAWAVPRLMGTAAKLLDHARLAYLGEVADDWSGLRAQARVVANDLNERLAALVKPTT